MKVTTTHDFLKAKLSNLRERLVEQHKANRVRVDELEAHLLRQSNLATYAAQLRGRDVRQTAEQIAAYVEAADRGAAVALVTQYLECFQSVTDNFSD